MPCLDEATILSFCRGKLEASSRASAEEHLAGCDDCRTLVAVVARSSVVRGQSPPWDTELPALGSPFGGGPEGVSANERSGVGRAAHVVTPLGLGPDHASADPMAPTTPVDRDRRPPSAPPTSPVKPGSVVAGKYDVERVLGAGGMGVVVAARHQKLGQRVALKFLLPTACEVPGAVDRFLREGQAAARITSEHVARVLDTGVQEDGAPYLVLEYLEGRDLGAVVEARGKLEHGEAIEYVLQACEAIAEAHALGIVHRDLKPANLFLSQRADGSPLVKVLDFGISKLEESGSRPALTSTSALMGSPRYMSPEQMLSAKDVDPRADVWALGVLLFELVTGRPVWAADTVQGLCALIATAPAPSIRDLAPDAPRELESLVADCLAKSRDERIPSVADLALRLSPIAPPRARTSIERIVRISGRTMPDAPAPGVPVPGAPAPGAPEREPTPPNTSPKRRMALAFAAASVVGVLGAYAMQRSDAPDVVPTTTSPPPESAARSPGDDDAVTAAPPEADETAEATVAAVAEEAPPSATAPELARAPLPTPAPRSDGTTKRAPPPTKRAPSPATATKRASAPPTTTTPPSSTNSALLDRK